MERFLTSLRPELLETACSDGADSTQENVLKFCCSLARQC